MLFRQHYRQMHQLAMVLLHDDAESKDIVHDVFAQLIASSAELHEETAAAFLLTSVRNRCLNVIRGRKIQERIQRHFRTALDQGFFVGGVPPYGYKVENQNLVPDGTELLTERRAICMEELDKSSVAPSATDTTPAPNGAPDVHPYTSKAKGTPLL